LAVRAGKKKPPREFAVYLAKTHGSIITRFHGLSEPGIFVATEHALTTWSTIFGPAIARMVSVITPVSSSRTESALSAGHPFQAFLHPLGDILGENFISFWVGHVDC
jgi:hypothetical protein